MNVVKNVIKGLTGVVVAGYTYFSFARLEYRIADVENYQNEYLDDKINNLEFNIHYIKAMQQFSKETKDKKHQNSESKEVCIQDNSKVIEALDRSTFPQFYTDSIKDDQRSTMQ